MTDPAPPPQPATQTAPAPTAGSGADRRIHTRRAIRAVARISNGSGGVLEARTIDASQGGLAISTSINPPVGAVFQIAFHIPGKQGKLELFTASVRVMYSAYASEHGGFKLGLQFTHIDPASEKLLRAFLA